MFNGRLRIGVVFDSLVYEYSELIIRGVRKACEEHDVELLIFSMGELHDIQTLFAYQNVAVTSFITKKNLDGVIFISATQMHFLSKSEVTSYIKSFLPLPIVNISTQIPGIPSVTVECHKAYEAILTDLVKNQNCKKFTILGVRNNSNEAKTRRNAIKSILASLDIPPENINLWRADYDYRVAYSELEYEYELKKSFDFDAMICLNDVMAYAALDFCNSKGIKVPEDIALVGFDDLERSEYCSTPLTSINQQIPEQGYKAVELLIANIQGEKVPANTVIESTAVFRESTCKVKAPENLDNNPYAKIGFRNHFYGAKYSGTEWYYKKDQFSQLTRYYTELQYDMTSEQLKRRLNEDIASFGVSAAAIIMYENPIEMSTPFDYFNLPHKAKVYSCFNKETGYDSNDDKDNEVFNPKNGILPAKIFKPDSEGTFIFSLYHNTLQYGYILLRPGNFDVLVYDMLVKILSTVISSIYTFALVNSETKKFRAKYDKLDVIASTDELTGLHNRRGLYDLGETALSLDEKSGHSGMIIYCDMDGLKHINDTIGHEAGDRAILAESIILKGNFRSNDIIARIGGDEFAIICPGLTEEAFERIKNQIDEDCDMWSLGNSSAFVLSISMGHVKYPSDKVGYQITPLLSEADSLMYIEKRRKKELKNSLKNLNVL